VSKFIANEVYRNEGLRGFYRGYILSTLQVSFNSALWWTFYYYFQGKIRPLVSDQVPTLAVQCMCGPLSSFSANLLTNPLDTMRTKMQVQLKRQSALECLKTLWKEDNYRLFYRGLTARLSYSCLYSFFIILGYETVKKHTLKEEYIESFMRDSN
jgi:solute carrier family 25 protein 44